MLRRGSAIAKRQGYYPTSDVCSGPGDTCAEACGAEYVECPSDGSVTSCHSTTDGSHCCTDGTGNACGPGDYCTHDNQNQTYCCPENLNAEECAKQLGLDVPLIPDSAETTTPVAEATGVPSLSPTPSPTETETESAVETETEEETSTVLVSASPSSLPSTTKLSSTKTTASPSAALPSVAKSSSSSSTKAPNATSTSPGLPQFTGGAAKVAGAGAAVLAAVVGLVIL
ncbi:hypothetical protein COCMIDRAFT_99903 [Bipolaris oryzae ATCC 44560]|uniref:Uncharacterized protein n=1 Tax=Bipolaris oryzae ATCC 44560 TaxID=930090 RepID=W6ZJN0_COCMI|nr:uncharacterized protein COCMIDRAFT_99903 [Bipolaris oryzae ATCC 44560]EUC43801.1 hypothetical protein COCMIDRAFT_99903 [Bipolaris oryzae ATCC 44560]